jgi:hypothetical protein
MTPRDVFALSGNTDARLCGDGGAVDYCLRVRGLGLRVVFTPACLLQRRVPAPIPRIDISESERLRAAWGPLLDRDPYYNPNLSTVDLDYRVAS